MAQRRFSIEHILMIVLRLSVCWFLRHKPGLACIADSQAILCTFVRMFRISSQGWIGNLARTGGCTKGISALVWILCGKPCVYSETRIFGGPAWHSAALALRSRLCCMQIIVPWQILNKEEDTDLQADLQALMLELLSQHALQDRKWQRQILQFHGMCLDLGFACRTSQMLRSKSEQHWIPQIYRLGGLPQSYNAVNFVLSYVVLEKPFEAGLAEHPVIRRASHAAAASEISFKQRWDKQQALCFQLLILSLLS